MQHERRVIAAVLFAALVVGLPAPRSNPDGLRAVWASESGLLEMRPRSRATRSAHRESMPIVRRRGRTERGHDWSWWAPRIRACESGGDYTARNPTSSASGAYQFLDSTWRATVGLAIAARWPRAYLAPRTVQDAAARRLFERDGLDPWLQSRSCWTTG